MRSEKITEKIFVRITAAFALSLFLAFFLFSCESIDAGTAPDPTLTGTSLPTENWKFDQIFSFDNGVQYSIDKDNACVIVSIGTFSGDTLTVPASDPEGRKVKSINDYAFKDCISLRSLSFEEGLTEICGGAFQGCTALESVTFPNSLIKIGTFAFSGCSSIRSLTIPKNVKLIGQSAFIRCSSLSQFTVDGQNEAYTAEDGVLFSADMVTLEAYPAGKTTAEYLMPDGVERINNSAFDSNQSISILKASDSFKEIDDHAFRNCPSLSAIFIPKGFKRIGVGVFYGCKNLATVNYSGSKDDWEKEKDNDDDKDFVQLSNTWKSNAGSCKIVYDVKY